LPASDLGSAERVVEPAGVELVDALRTSYVQGLAQQRSDAIASERDQRALANYGAQLAADRFVVAPRHSLPVRGRIPFGFRAGAPGEGQADEQNGKPPHVTQGIREPLPHHDLHATSSNRAPREPLLVNRSSLTRCLRLLKVRKSNPRQ
jgi:hypothetical protein